MLLFVDVRKSAKYRHFLSPLSGCDAAVAGARFDHRANERTVRGGFQTASCEAFPRFCSCFDIELALAAGLAVRTYQPLVACRT